MDKIKKIIIIAITCVVVYIVYTILAKRAKLIAENNAADEAGMNLNRTAGGGYNNSVFNDDDGSDNVNKQHKLWMTKDWYSEKAQDIKGFFYGYTNDEEEASVLEILKQLKSDADWFELSRCYGVDKDQFTLTSRLMYEDLTPDRVNPIFEQNGMTFRLGNGL